MPGTFGVRMYNRVLTLHFLILLSLSSAGIGVLSMAKQAAERMLGSSENMTANNQFWLLDKDVWSYSYGYFVNFDLVFDLVPCFTTVFINTQDTSNLVGIYHVK